MSKEEPLSDLLKFWLVEQGFRPALFQMRIADMWQSLMGDVVAKQTEGVKLDNRILYVRVLSSTLRSDLFYKRDAIRTRINEFIGEEYVLTVVIH
jgi:hypothetical protein